MCECWCDPSGYLLETSLSISSHFLLSRLLPHPAFGRHQKPDSLRCKYVLARVFLNEIASDTRLSFRGCWWMALMDELCTRMWQLLTALITPRLKA